MQKSLTVFILLTIVTFGVNAQTLEVGQQAPEISLLNPDGTAVKLSSLKGKVVYIDFWASWCAPCRRENPEIAEVFHKYKDADFEQGSGFAIYSVSLDKNKTSWITAFTKDNLATVNNVSDLLGWKSEAALTYGVKRIPASYLIDGEGNIIAINLNSDDLESQLKRMERKKKYLNLF